MSVTKDMQALLEARSISDKWDAMSPKARIKLLKKAKVGNMKYGRPMSDLSTMSWGELGPKYKTALNPPKGAESNDMYMLRSVGNYFRGK